MRNGLEHVGFWAEWASPIPLDENFKVRIWVVGADKGGGSVCGRIVTLPKVGYRALVLEENLKVRQGRNQWGRWNNKLRTTLHVMQPGRLHVL